MLRRTVRMALMVLVIGSPARIVDRCSNIHPWKVIGGCIRVVKEFIYQSEGGTTEEVPMVAQLLHVT